MSAETKKPTPTCIGCNTRPEDHQEYIQLAIEELMTPTQYVIEQEETYNPSNGHFYCTNCYIKAGMPLGVAP